MVYLHAIPHTTAAYHTSTAHSSVISHDFRLISLDYTAPSYMVMVSMPPPPTASRSFQCLFYTTDHSNERLERHTRRHTYTRSYTDYTTHIYDSEEFTLERVGEIPRIFTVFYAFTQRRVGLEWERGGGSGGASGSRHGSYSPSYSDRR